MRDFVPVLFVQGGDMPFHRPLGQEQSAISWALLSEEIILRTHPIPVRSARILR